MVKRKTKSNKKITIIFIVVLLLLILSNISLIVSYSKINQEELIVEEVLFTKTDKKFNSKKKYYASIKYTKFKKLLKKDEVSTIAIVDNSSNTYDKFIEMINLTSYHKSTKIYLLETSKLSKKEEKSFYNIDERLKDLETNYIISVSNGEIISITTFENSKINKIIEGLGE